MLVSTSIYEKKFSLSPSQGLRSLSCSWSQEFGREFGIGLEGFVSFHVTGLFPWRSHSDFNSLAYWQLTYNSALAIMVFICWVKVSAHHQLFT